MTAIQTSGRYGLALAGAAVVTFAVFFGMQQLIATGKGALGEDGERYVVDFVRVQEQEQVREKQRELPEPPQKPEEPPKPDMPRPSQAKNQMAGEALNIGPVAMNADLNLEAGIAGGGNSDYLPIVKVQPVYPRRALRRGIEGYVIVEFTVTSKGTVRNPRVVEAEPPKLFDEAALEAARKFKYRPKTINGEAVEVAGVRNIIRFQIAKDRR